MIIAVKADNTIIYLSLDDEIMTRYSISVLVIMTSFFCCSFAQLDAGKFHCFVVQ